MTPNKDKNGAIQMSISMYPEDIEARDEMLYLMGKTPENRTDFSKWVRSKIYEELGILKNQLDLE